MHLTPEVQTRFKVGTSVSDSTVEGSVTRRMREGRMILAPESDFPPRRRTDPPCTISRQTTSPPSTSYEPRLSIKPESNLEPR